MTLTYRNYKPDDEFKINAMFQNVFGVSRSLDDWYWKYRDHPLGSYKFTVAESEDGKIAAHYGGYPVKILSYNKNSIETIPTYHFGDKMTDPSFRNVGFAKTSPIYGVFDYCKNSFVINDGVKFGYGFGTWHSKKIGVLLLDYQEIQPVAYRYLDINRFLKINNIFFDYLLTPLLKIENVDYPDDSLTEFFYKVLPHYSIITERDKVYLKWRYFDRPDKKYDFYCIRLMGNIIGWGVFFRQGDTLIWGDALFHRYFASVSIRIFLKNVIAFYNDIKRIECWFSSIPRWFDKSLLANGFISEEEKNKLFLVAPLFDKSFNTDILNQWYYTMGDSDLF